MMKLSAANQFRRRFYQSGRKNSSNTEEMELEEVLPQQNEILEDLNSNQGISPLKSFIPCCCKPSQVENISRYVLISSSNIQCNLDLVDTFGHSKSVTKS
jgi:hypothetical protein